MELDTDAPHPPPTPSPPVPGHVALFGTHIPTRPSTTSTASASSASPPPPLIVVPTVQSNLEAFAVALCSGRPVVLEGPPGCGKSALLRHFAHLTGAMRCVCACDSPLYLWFTDPFFLSVLGGGGKRGWGVLECSGNQGLPVAVEPERDVFLRRVGASLHPALCGMMIVTPLRL